MHFYHIVQSLFAILSVFKHIYVSYQELNNFDLILIYFDLVHFKSQAYNIDYYLKSLNV